MKHVASSPEEVLSMEVRSTHLLSLDGTKHHPDMRLFLFLYHCFFWSSTGNADTPSGTLGTSSIP